MVCACFTRTTCLHASMLLDMPRSGVDHGGFCLDFYFYMTHCLTWRSLCLRACVTLGYVLECACLRSLLACALSSHCMCTPHLGSHSPQRVNGGQVPRCYWGEGGPFMTASVVRATLCSNHTWGRGPTQANARRSEGLSSP